MSLMHEHESYAMILMHEHESYAMILMHEHESLCYRVASHHDQAVVAVGLGVPRRRDLVHLEEPQGKGTVLATEAVETRGTGRVLATRRQWRHEAQAVS